MASPSGDRLARRPGRRPGSSTSGARTWSSTVRRVRARRGERRPRRRRPPAGRAASRMPADLVGGEGPGRRRACRPCGRGGRPLGLVGQLVARCGTWTGCRPTSGSTAGSRRRGAGRGRRRPGRGRWPWPPACAPSSSRCRRSGGSRGPAKPRTSSDTGAGAWSAVGHRDGVAVVGHDVEHGQVQRARRVEALPELALRAGALAEGDVGELVAVGARCRAGGGGGRGSGRPRRSPPRAGTGCRWGWTG